jgi:acetyl-CoA carboxylase carboxyl transferase subunit alpha
MSTDVYFAFEKPIYLLEEKITDLKKMASEENVDFSNEISMLENRMNTLIEEIFTKLTPWQKVQLARHPKRPYTIDYVNYLFEDFIELHGDRRRRDDKAILTGFAKMNDETFFIIGHQKGRDTKENLERNFGMANPEGYRKAKRIFKLAEKFNKTVITFIDTAGAYPGLEAEENGQAEAIAKNLFVMSGLKVPIIVCIIGEGGSGGALGIGVGDKILMLENSVYSVISPEGCAAILWKDPAMATEAASKLKITSSDLLKLKVIDKIVPEPLGGAHRNPEMTAANLKKAIITAYEEIKNSDINQLLDLRYKKWRKMGEVVNKI